MKRNIVLYLVTLDFLFLGVLAKGFLVSEVGDMLAEVRPVPAILFYLVYVVGILIFVSHAARNLQSTLLYGAQPLTSPRSRCSSIGAGRWRPSISPGARW